MIAYWGCWGEPGHYLWMPGKRHPNYQEEQLLPTPAQLDATILFLPRPEVVGASAFTYLPAPNFSILAWWGNPWDKRGKVNSAIIVEGRPHSTQIAEKFYNHFPELVEAFNKVGFVIQPPF